MAASGPGLLGSMGWNLSYWKRKFTCVLTNLESAQHIIIHISSTASQTDTNEGFVYPAVIAQTAVCGTISLCGPGHQAGCIFMLHKIALSSYRLY